MCNPLGLVSLVSDHIGTPLNTSIISLPQFDHMFKSLEKSGHPQRSSGKSVAMTHTSSNQSTTNKSAKSNRSSTNEAVIHESKSTDRAKQICEWLHYFCRLSDGKYAIDDVERLLFNPPTVDMEKIGSITSSLACFDNLLRTAKLDPHDWMHYVVCNFVPNSKNSKVNSQEIVQLAVFAKAIFKLCHDIHQHELSETDVGNLFQYFCSFHHGEKSRDIGFCTSDVVVAIATYHIPEEKAVHMNMVAEQVILLRDYMRSAGISSLKSVDGVSAKTIRNGLMPSVELTAVLSNLLRKQADQADHGSYDSYDERSIRVPQRRTSLFGSMLFSLGLSTSGKQSVKYSSVTPISSSCDVDTKTTRSLDQMRSSRRRSITDSITATFRSLQLHFLPKSTQAPLDEEDLHGNDTVVSGNSHSQCRGVVGFEGGDEED